jgi:hypothetical protein
MKVLPALVVTSLGVMFGSGAGAGVDWKNMPGYGCVADGDSTIEYGPQGVTGTSILCPIVRDGSGGQLFALEIGYETPSPFGDRELRCELIAKDQYGNDYTVDFSSDYIWGWPVSRFEATNAFESYHTFANFVLATDMHAGRSCSPVHRPFFPTQYRECEAGEVCVCRLDSSRDPGACDSYRACLHLCSSESECSWQGYFCHEGPPPVCRPHGYPQSKQYGTWLVKCQMPFKKVWISSISWWEDY